jgi:hypothetical protein
MKTAKHSVDFERIYPSLVSGALVAIAVSLVLFTPIRSWKDVLIKGCGTLLPSALNVSAIAVGFLATSQSLLLSLGSSRVISEMKKRGHYTRLLRFFGRAITVSFVWALVSAWLATFTLGKGGVWRYALVVAWAYLGACSVLCYYRATRILTEILLLQDETKPDDGIVEWNPDDGSLNGMGESDVSDLE